MASAWRPSAAAINVWHLVPAMCGEASPQCSVSGLTRGPRDPAIARGFALALSCTLTSITPLTSIPLTAHPHDHTHPLFRRVALPGQRRPSRSQVRSPGGSASREANARNQPEQTHKSLLTGARARRDSGSSIDARTAVRAPHPEETVTNPQKPSPQNPSPQNPNPGKPGNQPGPGGPGGAPGRREDEPRHPGGGGGDKGGKK